MKLTLNDFADWKKTVPVHLSEMNRSECNWSNLKTKAFLRLLNTSQRTN